MPAEVALGSAAIPRAGRSPGTVVARRTARKAARSGVLWGYVFAIYVATNALAFSSTYKTAAERQRLEATFGSNTAVSALVGPPHQIQEVGGFTAWKCLTTLAIVGAVWGLLAGTRLLRGEEDAGRWELLLAGRTTRRGAAAQAVAGLAVGLVALFAVTAVVVAVVGRSSKVDISTGAAAFFALATVSAAAVFLAVGALTSQLAPPGARPRPTPAPLSASATPCGWWPTRVPASSGCGGPPRWGGWRSSGPSPHRTPSPWRSWPS